jgi:hypothetical protein
MKTKLTVLAAFAAILMLTTASTALADSVHGSQDNDFRISAFLASVPNSGIHADSVISNQNSDHGPNVPTFDHIVARDFSPIHDCGCDKPPAAPEPSTFTLLAAALTPFFWVRRRPDV